MMAARPLDLQMSMHSDVDLATHYGKAFELEFARAMGATHAGKRQRSKTYGQAFARAFDKVFQTACSWGDGVGAAAR